jgi:hypothetical protein
MLLPPSLNTWTLTPEHRALAKSTLYATRVSQVEGR